MSSWESRQRRISKPAYLLALAWWHASPLIFFSLPFWFSLPFSFSRNSLRFCAFFPSFPRILGVRQAEEILAFLVVFLAVFQKGKEKKIGSATLKIWRVKRGAIAGSDLRTQRTAANPRAARICAGISWGIF